MFQPLSRSEERRFRALSRRKERTATGSFIAEGVRVVEVLLESKVELELALIAPGLQESERGRELIERLQGQTTMRSADQRLLASLAGTQTPQGVLVIARKPVHSLGELELESATTILVLDGVQDPGNLGTLVRTTAALGGGAVIVLPGTVDPWNPKSVRASAGALFQIPVIEAGPDELGHWLRDEGVTLYGAAVDGADLRGVEPAGRAALVVGNEGAGLSSDVEGLVDHLISVPIVPEVESLNVAVAAGIILFTLNSGRA